MASSAAVATTIASAAATPPAGATAQISYSGTPRGPTGITQPDDYVREMSDPLRRMEIFEEMRSSDDAVHTAIDSRRQEINAANWVLTTEDKTPVGTQILEFVEDNLYPVLDDVLRWLGGGGIQYGFAAIEPVYTWADRPVAGTITRGKIKRPTRSSARGLYLAKVAHLRQPAVTTFKITSNGDLEAVVQYAFDGNTFRHVEIPPEKLLLWTYDRQGDDRWGVPPTRHCYKAWTFKQQIEKLNLLHIDRFGVGLPVVEEGEGWGASERTTLAAFMKSWRSSGQNYLMHPNGGKITVVSDDGKTTMSMLEWVKYYNLAIAKTYLTQQTELGSTNTGARALGESFVEGMQGLVQADCEELAALLNDRLIKQMVDWNFGEQKSYPTFEPSQRVKIGGGAATMLLQLITAKAVHPRPEDEAFLRDAFGLPPVAIDTLKSEQDQRDATAAAIAATPVAGDATSPAPDAAKSGADATPPVKKPALAIAATLDHVHIRQLALVEGAPEPAVPYESTYRTPEYQAWEQGIVRPDVLVRDLDLASSRLAGEVQDVLHDIDANLEQQASALGGLGAVELSAGVRAIAVPEKLRTRLRAVLYEAAQRSRNYGAKAVHNEIARQLAPEGIGPQRDSWMPPTYAPYESGFFARVAARIRALVAGESEPTPGDLHLAAEVDRAAEDELARRETSIRSAILTALAQAAGAVGAVLTGIVSTASKAALIGLSTGRTESNVQGVVNVGFGIGRSDAAAAIIDNPSGLTDAQGASVGLIGKVYSAVMDLGTCDECAKWDAAEFPIDYPEDYTGVQAPNPRCAGGYSRCRCVWVYITSRESVPLVPAGKGPGPIRGGVFV